MFPSKSAMDYMNEMNRLFPKSESIESRNIAQNYNSPFHTATANKSSSSADSISPESYFDFQFYRQTDNYLSRNRCETPKRTFFESSTNINETKTFESLKNIYNTPMSPPNSIYGSPNLNMSPRNVFERQNIHETKIYEPTLDLLLDVPNYNINSETTFPVRRQRPIVGRKILGNSQQIQKNDSLFDFSQLEPLPQTLERNQKSYELFPSERSYLPATNNVIKQSDPYNNMGSFIKMPYNPGQQQQNPQYSSADGSSMYKMCTFCRKNGETPVVYMTHNVKEKISNRHIVTCPILRSHKCSTCGASGDDAHTITYCPVLRRSNNGKPLQSTTITLKNTRIKSNGRKRY
ncbi:uncharacterized protein LOC116775657 [Danaus plexippus]|uniref:uncharacterized protein LOC116775657 n=1 Tax=Danaus plexippus TaxID=13037 RepID=UPI002AB0EE4F|nr:uncharacterized protein LOC116775657 [Danaus plexippus]XP_061381104.1 uncharacterized protein LOC116775657 [Danaus plexippus]